MARVSAQERDKGIAKAKSLFLKGHEYEDIAAIVGFSEKTIRKWSNDNDWKKAKELEIISPSKVSEIILEAALKLKEGDVPDVPPKELAMLANAYEKMNDKKRFTRYAFDVMTEFSSYLIERAKKATHKKKKEEIWKVTQQLHELSDEFLTHLMKKYVEV